MKKYFRELSVTAALLLVLLAILVSYALWTVYANTLTPAALDQGPSMNTQPSPPGTLSPTAARALKPTAVRRSGKVRRRWTAR